MAAPVGCSRPSWASLRPCRSRRRLRPTTPTWTRPARPLVAVASMNTETSLVPQTEPLSRTQLIESLEAGCKAREDFRIGTEHEKFGFYDKDFRRLNYQDINALLKAIGSRFDWDPVMEDGNIIGLSKDKMNISLEPGGQLELSGAPLKTVHETCKEVNAHLKQVENVASEMGIGFLGLGFDPLWKRDEIPIMPKGRYEIMRKYMPKVGSMGLDMMFRTCTIQVNLDFESEQDMIRKMRVSLALQPVATALFANSPFTEGKPNGHLSKRSHVWTDTDNQRSGILPFVFQKDFGFEKYVDYALDVPMYFLYRNKSYVDVTGSSFRKLKDGKLEKYPGEFATMADWNNHLTTIFPEVRLKKYIEMRGADGGPWKNICALPAFWVGILYDDQALDEAEQLIRDWTVDDIQKMRDDVTHLALKTQIKGRSLQDVAKDVLKISKGGLLSRGFGEHSFLWKLEETAKLGKSPAEVLLDKFHNSWDGDIMEIYADQNY